MMSSEVEVEQVFSCNIFDYREFRFLLFTLIRIIQLKQFWQFTLVLAFCVPYWHSSLHSDLFYTHTVQLLWVYWCTTFQYLCNLSLPALLSKPLPEIYDELRLKASRAYHLKRCESETIQSRHRQRERLQVPWKELVVLSLKARYSNSFINRLERQT